MKDLMKNIFKLRRYFFEKFAIPLEFVVFICLTFLIWLYPNIINSIEIKDIFPKKNLELLMEFLNDITLNKFGLVFILLFSIYFILTIILMVRFNITAFRLIKRVLSIMYYYAVSLYFITFIVNLYAKRMEFGVLFTFQKANQYFSDSNITYSNITNQGLKYNFILFLLNLLISLAYIIFRLIVKKEDNSYKPPLRISHNDLSEKYSILTGNPSSDRYLFVRPKDAWLSDDDKNKPYYLIIEKVIHYKIIKKEMIPARDLMNPKKVKKDMEPIITTSEVYSHQDYKVIDYSQNKNDIQEAFLGYKQN